MVEVRWPSCLCLQMHCGMFTYPLLLTTIFVIPALSEYSSPHLDLTELVAHVFMRSVNNITIEHGWLPLHIQWGDNVKVFWEAGSDIVNLANPHHQSVEFPHSLTAYCIPNCQFSVILSSGCGPPLSSRSLTSYHSVSTVMWHGLIETSKFPLVSHLMLHMHFMLSMMLRIVYSL